MLEIARPSRSVPPCSARTPSTALAWRRKDRHHNDRKSSSDPIAYAVDRSIGQVSDAFHPDIDVNAIIVQSATHRSTLCSKRL